MRAMTARGVAHALRTHPQCQKAAWSQHKVECTRLPKHGFAIAGLCSTPLPHDTDGKLLVCAFPCIPRTQGARSRARLAPRVKI